MSAQPMAQSNRRIFRFRLLALALLAIVAVLGWCFKPRQRFLSDEALLVQLAEAEFLDDPPAEGSAWPQWLGPNRDGVTTATLQTTWPARGPRTLWEVPGGDGYSSLVQRDGRAYTLLVGEDGKEAVVCLDLTSKGQEVWRYAYEASANYSGYPGPRSTPTLGTDRLFALSSVGNLMCLNLADGKPIWQVDLQTALNAPAPRFGFACSPLLDEGVVYLAAGGQPQSCLAAFRASDGEQVWTAQEDPVGYSSPVLATVAGTKQIVFFTGRRLLGVRHTDGSLLWEYPWVTDFDVNAATPLIVRARSGGENLTYVFVTSGYGRGSGMVKIESGPGGTFRARRVYESTELCGHFSTPIRYQGHVYGMDEKRDLSCLDLRTGQIAWRFERPAEDDGSLRMRAYKKGSVLRVGEVLIVLGEEGKLALVEASPQAYRELAAARPFRDRTWTMPTLAEGKLLLRDRRKVKCLDMAGVSTPGPKKP